MDLQKRLGSAKCLGYNVRMEARQYIPHYTIADYKTWKGDWELWQGIPVSMSPAPNRFHQRVAGRLFRSIQDQLEANDACHCEALYEVDWHIADDTVVCPDIVIECEPNDQPVVVHPPSLVVEVFSSATRKRDLTVKRDLYQSQGVGHYLMADPESRTLALLALREGGYQPTDLQHIDLHPGCSLSIDVARLWDS